MNVVIDARPINNRIRHGILIYAEGLVNGLAEIDGQNRYYLLYTSLRKKAESMPGPVQKNFSKNVLLIADGNMPFKRLLFSKVYLPVFLSMKQADIFHSPCDTLLLGRIKAKYILTIHDLKSFVIRNDIYDLDMVKFGKAIRRADRIIAVSNFTKKDIIERYQISPDKISVVHLGTNGIDKGRFHEDQRDYLDKRYGIKRRYFLGIGRAPRKNAKGLITAFSMLKYNGDFNLVITGVQNSDMLREYTALTQKLKIEDKVIFPGYIEDNDFGILFKYAECFIYPSLYEGFGLPILEAMSCGTPVITSDITSLPEVGGDAALYVNPYDEEEIAGAIEKIIDDSEIRISLIDRGFKRVQEFSWQKTAEETLKVYKSCCQH